MIYTRMDRRIAFISRWAEANGFAFDIADPDDEILSLPLILLNALYRSVWNVVRGEWNGIPIEAFDLTVGTAREGYAGSTCAITALPIDSPSLLITHRSVRDSVADVIVPRIQTESSAFDDEWEVRCADRFFANAVVHQRLMEWLQSRGDTPPRTSFELGGPWLLAVTAMLGEKEYEVVLDELVSFTTQMPHFLPEQYPLST